MVMPARKMMQVRLEDVISNYAYLVPCVENEKEYFLKTIIPSRKATKKYLEVNDES